MLFMVVGANKEVGLAPPVTANKDALVDHIGTAGQSAPGFARCLFPPGRPWVGDPRYTPTFLLEPIELSPLVLVALRREEVCLWSPPLLEHTTVRDLQIEASQVLALEEVIEVAWREDQSVSEPLHLLLC